VRLPARAGRRVVRATYTGVSAAMAGCDVCHGTGVGHWQGRNALAVASRHHKATGHTTWAEQVISAQWGDRGPAANAEPIPGLEPEAV
jgi:hypothetical protein